MNPKDLVFQKAKAIILGKEEPLLEFQLLAKEIKGRWNADLVNGDVYFYKQLSNPLRLRLILEPDTDRSLLPKLWHEQRDQIGSLFTSIVDILKIDRYHECDLSALHIDLFSFEKIAFKECVNLLDSNVLRREFSAYPIWRFEQFHDGYFVFYYTKEDVTIYEKTGLNQRIKNRIQELGKQNDAFGALKNQNIIVKFDSKEIFELAGGGLNYYR